jgi:phage gp36-like protein
MAVTYPFTTEALIAIKLGQLGVDLRTDDVDYDDDIEDVIDSATWEVAGYFNGRYSMSLASANGWVQQVATWLAILELCHRRGNEPPAGVVDRCKRYYDLLGRVMSGAWKIPELARTRRPGVVTNHTVVLRDWNNQGKVDTNRSTGLAEDYRRPTDQSSPDCR